MTTRTLYISLGVGAVLLVLGWWFLWPTRVKNYPPHQGPIVAFGDSLVAGYGSNSGHDFVSLLSENIGKPIENMGTPGDTTEQGLARVAAVIAKHPSVVILLLGGNDYLQKKPRDETFKNLGEIIQKLQADGAVVLLLGVRGGLLHDNFASEFSSLSRTYGTAYVPDVMAGIIGNSKMLSDEVHPNDAGYALIAGRVYPVLKKLVQ